MKTVSARFDCGADDAALKVAEFGGRVLGNEIKFLNRVRSRRKPEQVIRHLIVVHAVQDEIVSLFAVAVDVRPGSIRGIVAIIEVAGIRRYRAWSQQG